MFSVWLVSAAIFCLLMCACSAKNRAASGAETVVLNYGLSAGQRERAARIAATLDDRLLAAQVIISGIDGRGRLARDMKNLLEECPAGGIMLFRYNLDTENEAIQSLIDECAVLIAGQNAVLPELTAGIRPFTAVDHEGGTVNRFRPGAADLPPAGSYWNLVQSRGLAAVLGEIEDDGFRAALAVNSVGVNMNIAPVAEYLTGENSVFLADRSYGPDPVFSGEASAAFIRGMERAGVLCAVKHFPGSAGEDPHRFPSVLSGDKAALDALAAPFAALIRGGQARAVMVSHSAVPALDSRNIASLSPTVLGGWLRGELGFEGIIISDDFSMTAASGQGISGAEAAVQSLAAGADMVLVWPPDLRRTHRAIQAALDKGGLSRQRLREAAERIIFEKIRMGLVNGE
jgi:beta-N-acetylhexosaminidase